MKIANDIFIPELARLLAEEKEVQFTPSGVSMRPFIEGDKDSVVLAAYTREPRRGDIVLAQVRTTGERVIYVLHRIVRIERKDSDGQTMAEPVYILQGDGNLSGFELCRRDQIIGRVIRIENPEGKRKRLVSGLFSRGLLWIALRPFRPLLLKLYRHTFLKWNYK